MMILSIGGADYSYRYRLQPIVLVIGPFTRMADASVGEGAWGKTPMRGKMPMDNISQISNSWSLLCVTLASASFVNTSYSLKVDFVSIYKLQRKF